MNKYFTDEELDTFINSIIDQTNTFVVKDEKQLTPAQIGKLMNLHMEAIDHLIEHPSIVCGCTKSGITAISFHLKSLSLFVDDTVSERIKCQKRIDEEKVKEPDLITKVFSKLGLAREDKKVH